MTMHATRPSVPTRGDASPRAQRRARPFAAVAIVAMAFARPSAAAGADARAGVDANMQASLFARADAMPDRVASAGPASGALAFTASSVSPSVTTATAVATSAPPARWIERLGRLDPLRPLDYLELGEEVADAATTEEELALARTLFGYAGALDTARLGRSAMLALAAIAPNDLERSRALAAAEIVGGRGLARGAERVDPAQIASLSRAFSFHRRGDWRRALAALRQDDADALLGALDAAIPGGAQAFRDEARAMRSSGGLATDENAIRRLEDIELALRLGPLRPVSLDLVVAGDAPLVEIDLADPASVWRVDPARPWWRNGAWSGRD